MVCQLVGGRRVQMHVTLTPSRGSAFVLLTFFHPSPDNFTVVAPETFTEKIPCLKASSGYTEGGACQEGEKDKGLQR
jgi:hypothetical protein